MATAAGQAITTAQIDQICAWLRSDTAPQPGAHIGGTGRATQAPGQSHSVISSCQLKSLSPNAACLRGQACGRPARAGWPVSGSRGPVLREAADAFVVGPGGAAVLVLLPPAVRRAAAVRGRRTWRAEMAALSRASCW